jgi:KaiC/GvpD/RAD55 family RecA-like ATPase
MRLSAPIYVLKQQAKTLSQREGVRLHVALDRIAVREGFTAWSHLASSWQRQDRSRSVYKQLREGDLTLLGSRPGQGKTLLGAGLAIEAMSGGHHAAFFTLEATAEDVDKLFGALGRSPAEFQGQWLLDTSEDISAASIVRRLADTPPGTLVVIDYLQLLDQRRDKPSLDVQVNQLKQFAQANRAIVVCLSQIGREYTLTSQAFPSLRDVRLPNPADLSLFDKACFIHAGKTQVHVASSSGAS